ARPPASARRRGSSPTTSTWCSTSSRPRRASSTGSRISGATCPRRRPKQPRPERPISAAPAAGYRGPVALTTNQKGAIAEAAITKAALELGIGVYRPVAEGGRCDLIFARERELIRVQCKWAPVYRNVVVVRCHTSRRTASGLIHRSYAADEVDACAAYCA